VLGIEYVLSISKKKKKNIYYVCCKILLPLSKYSSSGRKIMCPVLYDAGELQQSYYVDMTLLFLCRFMWISNEILDNRLYKS